MPNAFLSRVAAWWKTVLWYFVVCLISLSFAVQQTRKLAEANRRLALQMTFPESVSEAAQRLADVEKENEQLRADLATIPTLAATHDRLRNELAQQETQQTAAWAGSSNGLIVAIAKQREVLADIYRQSSEEQRRKAREQAQQRLAEKAADDSQEPAQEYGLLKERLQQVALATKRLMDLRTERAAADKTEENKVAFRARFKKAVSDRMRALEQLGQDQVLYETLPLPPTIEDASKVPLLRSFLPDRHGVSATVYLDGTVVFSTTNPSP